MAGAETLPGGDTAQESLSEDLFDIVDGLFSDAQGGTAVETVIGTTSLIVAKGANNEDQAVLIPPTTPSVLNLTDLGLVVTVPASVGLTFEGSQAAGIEAATNFLSTQASLKIASAQTAINNSGLTGEALNLYQTALDAITSSVTRGIDFLSANADPSKPVTRVNLVNVLDNSSTTGSQITVDMNASDGSVVSALNLSNVKAGNTVLIANADKVLLVGTGTVQLSDSVNSSAVGDSRAQVIIGGAGNDTLVGGGGADTLSGGAGSNTFGLSATSQLTISDFDIGSDKLLITLDGVTDLASLKSMVVSGELLNGNSVFTLTDGSQITLVGVNPNSITADLLQFNS